MNLGAIFQFLMQLLGVFSKHQEAQAHAADRKAGADAVVAKQSTEILDAVRQSEAARDAVERDLDADPGRLRDNAHGHWRD